MRIASRFTLVLFLLIAFSIALTPAYGANATVTDCTNFTGAGSVSDAVTTANSGGGTITFTCSGTIIFTTELTITATVIMNANGNTVIFDEVGNDNRFFVVNAGASLTLNNFTLQNGNGNSGGAIFIFGSLTINNSTFIGNSGTLAGGAIANSGSLTVNNSTFTGNSVTDFGGAIFNDIGTTAIINNSTFTGNSATSSGGAIDNAGTLTISNSIFTNNLGAIGSSAIFNSGTLTSQDSHYENNTCANFGTLTDNGGNTVVSAGSCPGSAPIALNVSALACNADNAEFTINAGDANFDITGTGPGLPISNSPAGLITLTGAGSWTGITVTERRGERQSINLGDITCSSTTPLVASATCVGDDLQVTISAGDANFDITGAGPNLPVNNVGVATHTITGPSTWLGVTVTELSGNGQIINLGNYACPSGPGSVSITTCDFATLQAAIVTANIGGGTITFNCSGTIVFDNLLNITNNVTINSNGNTVIFDETDNDDFFFFVDSGARLTLNGFTLQNGNGYAGGAIWNHLNGTLIVNDSAFIGNSSTAIGGAIFTDRATLIINNSTFTNNSAGTTGSAISFNLSGSVTITNSTFIGNSSNNGGTIQNFGQFGAGTVTINTSTFTNNTGGVILNEVGSNGTTISNSVFTNNIGGAILNGSTVSSQNSHYENNTCTNFGSGVINDLGGNTRNTAVTSAGCPGGDPIALDVSALTCNGDNAEFTINAGDANFDMTGTGAGLPITNSTAGLITLTGAGSWTNITITELSGDRQIMNIGGISCPEAVIIPPSAPVSPTVTVTVLGCALDSTDGVEVANAPDNTYCRVLMRNGGVVSYSGAVPADLISLGVILAVDVYRLEGGQTINTFPDYARICLSGQGRYFYMDSRNAPRVSMEMPTEIVNGLTCAWIPAPGTVILTN